MSGVTERAREDDRGSDFNHGGNRGFGSICAAAPATLWNTGIAERPCPLITTNSGVSERGANEA